MSPDRLKQLAIALVALVVLWSVASLLRGGSDELGGSDFAFPRFDPAALSEVSLVGGGDSVVLARHPDGWRVNGYDADDEMAEALVAALGSDSAGAELVSVNELSHQRMGVGANGRLVTLRGPEGDLGSVVFGNRGPTFGTLFVRSPESSHTYLVPTELASQIARRRDDWRDHRVLGLDPDSISDLEVSRRSGGYRVVRGDSAWTFANGAPTDSAAVSRMLERFRSLRASGFAADSDSVDLDDPDLTIAVRGAGGREFAVLAFDSIGTDYWVRESEGGTVFKIANWAVRQLAPADSLLRSRP